MLKAGKRFLLLKRLPRCYSFRDREAARAKLALEDCNAANFYPILISAGAPGVHSAMQAGNANCISVGSTSASDL